MQSELYIYNKFNRQHRRAMAQFRMGTAPIKLETDIYCREGYIPVAERLCPCCNMETEDEVHVIIRCGQYKNIRQDLFNKVLCIFPHFTLLNDFEKYKLIMTEPSLVKCSAKACFLMLQSRQDEVYFKACKI